MSPEAMLAMFQIEGEVPLDFDGWASLSARLVQRSAEERALLLREREIAPEDFEACDRHWTMTLAVDLMNGRTERSALYGARCAEEMRRRAQEASREAANVAVAEVSAPPPAPAPAPAPAVDAAPLVAPAPAHTGSVSLSSTVLVQHRDQPALPFAKGTPSEPRAASPRTAAPQPRQGSGTVDISAALQEAVRAAPSTPFPTGGPSAASGASPAVLGLLTIEQYASLTVELDLSPDKSAEILARYRIPDEATRTALEEAWRVKLGSNPLVRLNFRDLQTKYREWLVKNRGTPGAT